jgi:type I restriction enzyme, S subunit
MANFTTLADVCESVRYGYTASASLDACGPRFLRITDIVPDSIQWDLVPYCEIDDSNKERFTLDVGDIVIARTGATVGYAKLIREPVDAVFASYLVRFRVDSTKADPGFIGRLVESQVYKSFVQSRIGGAAQPNASAPVLGSFEFRLPPLFSQERIADILSGYDDLIENNRRRMALLEDSARLLYNEWFVRLRFPGYEHTSIVDGVPEGWERRTAFESMQVLSGGTPKTSVPNYWGGEIPFYTPKDATNGVWVTDCERSVTEGGLKNCNSKLYPKETVFISARGTVGKLNMAQRSMVMSQSCYALVGKDHLSQSFVYAAMQAAVDSLRQHAVGAVFDAIVVDTFKRIKLLVPPPVMISLFDDTVHPILEQVENLTLQNQKLRAARDLLLPRLMSGEIAV